MVLSCFVSDSVFAASVTPSPSASPSPTPSATASVTASPSPAASQVPVFRVGASDCWDVCEDHGEVCWDGYVFSTEGWEDGSGESCMDNVVETSQSAPRLFLCEDDSVSPMLCPADGTAFDCTGENDVGGVVGRMCVW